MSHGAEAVAKPHGSFIWTLLGHSFNRVTTVTVAYCHRARAGATDGRLWSSDSNVHTWRSKGGRIHITRCSALPVNYFYSGARVPSLSPAGVIWAASPHLTPWSVTQQVCSLGSHHLMPDRSMTSLHLWSKPLIAFSPTIFYFFLNGK